TSVEQDAVARGTQAAQKIGARPLVEISNFERIREPTATTGRRGKVRLKGTLKQQKSDLTRPRPIAIFTLSQPARPTPNYEMVRGRIPPGRTLERSLRRVRPLSIWQAAVVARKGYGSRVIFDNLVVQEVAS